MINCILKTVESRRKSSKIYWKILIYLKDLIWKKINGYLSLYLFSFLGGLKYKSKFKDLKTYCMFVGYPRSAHSLVGSILDAHPNMIISHELNVLKYLERGFKKYQIYYLILNNSKNFNKINRNHEGYKYFVNNQWHARFSKLTVIGDKMGGGSSHWIKEKPWLMEKLFKINKNINFKFIHVIRNPYDNITTMAKKENMKLNDAIDWYFFLVDSIKNMKNQPHKYKIIDIKHENFINNPKTEISRICNFLGVKPYKDYLNNCSNLVWDKPHQTRSQIEWTPESIQKVKNKINTTDFLKNYSYDK